MWPGSLGLIMGRGTWSWIVPDGLWEITEPLIPPSRVRPQGGGTQDTPDETLLAAIIYVLVSGCAWAGFAAVLRDIEVDRASPVPDLVAGRCWGRVHEEILHRLDDAGLLDLFRAVLDSAHVRAKERGRTHRSESRGPGHAGFQDARPVGRERTVSPRRRLRGKHTRQPRLEAHGRQHPNETRPAPKPETSNPSACMPTRPTTSTDTKTRHLHRLQWVRRGNLKAAETAGRLTSKLGSYLRPSVLAVDEVSKRYEKGSTRPSANGVRSLATKSAPPRSSTGSCTTAKSSPSTAPATGSKTDSERSSARLPRNHFRRWGTFGQGAVLKAHELTL